MTLHAWLDRVPAGYTPSGMGTTVDKPQLVMRVVYLSLLMSAGNSALMVAVLVVNAEPVPAAVSLALLALYTGAFVDFRRHGNSRRTVLLVVLGSAAANLVTHVLLGGYLWSGGVVLWGVALTTTLALWIDTRVTVLGVACYAVVALVLVPLEPVLQAARPQPALVVSVVQMVDLFLATLMLMPLTVAMLVTRVRTERARSRRLLLNVLPASVATRLQEEPGTIAEMHPACTVVFADLVGFTAHARGLPPRRVVDELSMIFTTFDALCDEHHAEKIKTIGDGYLAVCGLPEPDPDHLAHGCDLALAMQEAMAGINAAAGTDFGLRVGLHTGELVAGVIGTAKFAYDVWGETVNLASRLESAGEPGQVTTSQAVRDAAGPGYRAEPRGILELKGQGSTAVYALTRDRAAGAVAPG